MPLGADRHEGTGPPVRCAEGPFAGWLRVALVEQEIRPGEDHHSGTLTRVAAGLWCGEPPGRFTSPFEGAATEWRWHAQRPVQDDELAGALATYWQDEHLVIYDSLVSLRPAWMAHLGLTPSPLPSPLDLIDENQTVGAVVRCWRMRPYSYDYSPPSPMIRGAELLLRPALAEIALAAGQLSEITRVRRDHLASH